MAMNYWDRMLIVMAITGIAIIGAVALILSFTLEAHSAVCLSKKEARQLWPKTHIYWYSADHCWSNRRGPPRGIKIDPVPNDPVFPKQSMAKAEDEDKCCWPKLDTDANGGMTEPPQSFKERWYEFPSVFIFFRQRMLP